MYRMESAKDLSAPRGGSDGTAAHRVVVAQARRVELAGGGCGRTAIQAAVVVAAGVAGAQVNEAIIDDALGYE